MDPPKNGPSVSTEIAAAPASAYAAAWAAGSRSPRMTPADGERRFTSAISATRSRRSAPANEGGGGGIGRAALQLATLRAQAPRASGG